LTAGRYARSAGGHFSRGREVGGIPEEYMTDGDMMDIRHDTAARCFKASLDGHDAAVEYDLLDGRMVITHTRVPDGISGRGVASRLTRAAFEHARQTGLRVRPMCSYAAGWIERHPDYRALLD
jgi:predicted GNAT family acetyltransferase